MIVCRRICPNSTVKNSFHSESDMFVMLWLNFLLHWVLLGLALIGLNVREMWLCTVQPLLVVVLSGNRTNPFRPCMQPSVVPILLVFHVANIYFAVLFDDSFCPAFVVPGCYQISHSPDKKSSVVCCITREDRFYRWCLRIAIPAIFEQ